MHQPAIRIISCFILLFGFQTLSAQEAISFEERVKTLEHFDGFFDLYWDSKQGQLLLAIDRFDEQFIYQSSMPRGVGSNDLGLDRGRLGDTRLVEFFRSGPKVLLIENNLDYRANSSNQAERDAVAGSFARSVVWGFNVVQESGDIILVDATSFFLSDSQGLAEWLSRSSQGSFTVDATRSAIFLPRTRAFPDNTEIESIITFTGSRKFDENGAAVSDILPSVVPDPSAITVHLHHSLVRLPDNNYTPLPYDPRAGIIGTGGGNGYFDYATDIGEPINVINGRRHRLQKKDPEASVSEAVEPIIYYVDPGAPEPIRSALIEGASWWNQAFDAAGYKDAFQVRLLPEDADPMDVRYNVIQWVHRSTRGWSYGASVLDPRSGEIIKGHVTLGSLRVRQDYLIAEGLLSPYQSEEVPDTMLEMSLARIRQLSAHEVGHTIGMEHNFAASVNNRASVMDYPFPLIRFDGNGDLDLSDAYGVGIGDWDKRTVLYAYQDFPDSVDENLDRQQILQDTLDSGLLYVSDEDSRDPGTAHPLGNLWDNGEDAIAELEHLLKVRAYALSRFGPENIRLGRPMAEIEEVLVPLYLLHRFQLEAVGKLIGGQYFNYAMRGDGQAMPVTVDAVKQNGAITALLKSLEPEVLLLPQSLVNAIPARPPGHSLTRESFSRTTGVLFDPLAPASSVIGLTLDVLLHPERAVRMNRFHAADAEYPSFENLLAAVLGASWRSKQQSGMNGALQRLRNDMVLQRLLSISSDSSTSSELRAQALKNIRDLDKWLEGQTDRRLDADWVAHFAYAQTEIASMISDPSRFTPSKALGAPPGGPIGN